MSSPVNAITPALFQGVGPVSFVAGNGTAAKVIMEPQVGSAAVGTLPAFYGGSTVIDLLAASTDAAAKDIFLYQGNILTTQGAGPTGAMATAATNTVTRAVGSFITDGFLVGDVVMLFSPVGTAPNAAVDGIVGVLSGVAAGVLTTNGAPWANLALAAGTRVVKVGLLFRATIAANSGNSATIPNTALLGNSMDSSAIRTEHKLGATDMMIAAMQAAVSALPAFVSVCGQVARY